MLSSMDLKTLTFLFFQSGIESVDLFQWRSLSSKFKSFVHDAAASAVIHNSIRLSREFTAQTEELHGLQSLLHSLTELTRLIYRAAESVPSKPLFNEPTNLSEYLQHCLSDQSVQLEEKMEAVETLRSCWLHYALLMRDILLRRPDLLALSLPMTPPSAPLPLLSSLEQALLPREEFPLFFAKFGHLTPGEVLFAFLLANLSSGLMGKQEERRQGRRSLLHWLMSKPHILPWLVTACTRSHSAASSMFGDVYFHMEGATCLLDVAELVVKEGEGEGALLPLSGTLSAALLSSRLLVTLMQSLNEFQERDMKAWAATAAVGQGLNRGGAVETGLANRAGRLVELLTILCLRAGSGRITEFVLGCPNLVPALTSVLVVTNSEQSGSRADMIKEAAFLGEGLLLPPHSVLCLLAALACTGLAGSTRSQLLRATSLWTQWTCRHFELLMLLLDNAAGDTSVIDGSHPPPMEEGRVRERQKAVNQLLRLADSLKLLTLCGNYLRGAKEVDKSELRNILSDLCGRCLMGLQKISGTKPVDSDLQDEGDSDSAVGVVEAAINTAKKSLKGLQSSLDENISSSKVD